MADETKGPKGETAADKKIRLELELLERQARISEVQLETAELRLEAEQDANTQLKAMKAAKKLQNHQRQAQLAIDSRTKVATARQCSHKQGGSPDDRFGGEGDSALNVCKLPDGFTKMIMCSICTLRVYSPHPRNMAKRQLEGENVKQRELRVKRYEEDLKEFNVLLKMSRKKKTKEAKQEMDCGVVMEFTDIETGMTIQKQRPCDSYAVQMRDMLREIHAA